MRVIFEYTKNLNREFTPCGDRLLRALLWHSGEVLPNTKPLSRDRVTVVGVRIDGLYLTQVESIEDLQGMYSVGAFFQDHNYLYIRAPVYEETPTYASSTRWAVGEIEIRAGLYLSDDKEPDYGLLQFGRVSRLTDWQDYTQISEAGVQLSILKDRLTEPSSLLGTMVSLRAPDLDLTLDRYIVSAVQTKEREVYLTCADLRTTLKRDVVDQKFGKDYKNASGNVVIEKEVAESYKKEVAGYCREVVADCLNGYAFDTQNYRLYRVGYGSMSIERVEIEQDEEYVEGGWSTLTNYTIDTVSETLPSGEVITTQVLKVPVVVAHPPWEGSAEPRYEDPPKRIRVTGVFRSDVTDISTVFGLLRYLIDRYSATPFTDYYFNTLEVENELAYFEDVVGICLDDPVELARVVETLQGGVSRGWQLCAYDGLLTVRVHRDDRPSWGKIENSEILNEHSLALIYDSAGATDISVEYDISYSEDAGEIVEDVERAIDARTIWTIESKKELRLITKEKEDAETRLEVEYNKSTVRAPRVEGLEVFGKKYFYLRQFDVVDLSLLGHRGRWYVSEVQGDLSREVVTLSLVAESATGLDYVKGEGFAITLRPMLQYSKDPHLPGDPFTGLGVMPEVV